MAVSQQFVLLHCWQTVNFLHWLPLRPRMCERRGSALCLAATAARGPEANALSNSAVESRRAASDTVSVRQRRDRFSHMAGCCRGSLVTSRSRCHIPSLEIPGRGSLAAASMRRLSNSRRRSAWGSSSLCSPKITNTASDGSRNVSCSMRSSSHRPETAANRLQIAIRPLRPGCGAAWLVRRHGLVGGIGPFGRIGVGHGFIFHAWSNSPRNSESA